MSRYIDAEQLKQILKPSEWGTPDERWIPEHEIGAMLDYFPSADVVEVRHGRWLQPYHNRQYKKCSVCESVFSVNLPKNANYCPNCGARMDEEGE